MLARSFFTDMLRPSVEGVLAPADEGATLLDGLDGCETGLSGKSSGRQHKNPVLGNDTMYVVCFNVLFGCGRAGMDTRDMGESEAHILASGTGPWHSLLERRPGNKNIDENIEGHVCRGRGGVGGLYAPGCWLSGNQFALCVDFERLLEKNDRIIVQLFAAIDHGRRARVLT